VPGRSIVARVFGPSRFWEWKVALIAMALSALHAIPAYDQELHGDLSHARLKGEHLLTHLGGDSPTSHLAKLDFRLVVPVLLRPFHGSPVAAAVLYAVCGVVVYAVFARGLKRAGLGDVTIALGLCAVAVTPAGGIFLLSLRYFDPVAIALAVLAAATRRAWLAVPLVVLALYTDERALIAVVLAALAVYWLEKRNVGPAVGAGVAVWFVSRIVLDRATDLRVESAETGLGVITHNISTWPIGLLMAFVCFWVLLAFGLWYLLQERSPVSFAIVACVGVAIAGAVAVDDVTRSISYALPVVPVVIAVLAHRWTEVAAERRFALAFVASLLVPAFVMAGDIGRANPLPVQVLRWTGVL
jgi:hypothetical protein